MCQEIEIEFKNLLTKNEFEALKLRFNLSNDDFISQENHYFDTQDFLLKSHKSALRIRIKHNLYMLTLKQPHEQGLLETHQELTKEQAISLLNGASLQIINGKIKECIIFMGIQPKDIIYLGTLRTNRAEVKQNENLLVLDHSLYLNHEDYEIEYEVKDPIEGKQKFIEILEQNKIPLRITDNKILRFFQKKLQEENKI